MGFISGDRAGHSITWILLFAKQDFLMRAVCLVLFSCIYNKSPSSHPKLSKSSGKLIKSVARHIQLNQRSCPTFSTQKQHHIISVPTLNLCVNSIFLSAGPHRLSYHVQMSPSELIWLIFVSSDHITYGVKPNLFKFK